MAIKRIGVLTSGGDASGMNAAIRAVVRSGLSNGLEVFGIAHGYQGLINGELTKMDYRSVSEILHRGGTSLYSSRCDEFKTEAGVHKAVITCKQFGLEGVVTIGGDGTFRGASDLSRAGVPCIGIPGTIDNDIACTEYTIGVDTALNTIIQSVDKIRDTSLSHDRCSIVEVMGRHCGYLALRAAVATGAAMVLIPEKPFDFDRDIVERMRFSRGIGKKHFIMIVAEGVKYPGGTDKLAEDIEEAVGVKTRYTVLGYVQRGGSPTAQDRIVATEMGNYAVELLVNGKSDRVIGSQGNKLVDYDIQEALKMTKPFEEELYNLSHRVSI